MDAIEQALALLKPRDARVTASQWRACDAWGVYLFDGGTQIAGAMGRTYADACAAMLADAKAKAKGAAPVEQPAKARRSLADLLGE